MHFRGSVRGWLGAFAGSAVVACVWAADVGFQFMIRGRPGWWVLPNTFLTITLGVALTPAVFVLFRRLLADPRSLPIRISLYAGIGLTFWLLWSVLAFGLGKIGIYFGPAGEADLATSLFRSAAGISFSSLLLYSVMALLYETARHVREARRQELMIPRMQAELTRAQMAALRARLNPHFLFNTLHVASGLTSSDVGAARQVLSDLGELLRASLAESGTQLVPLRSEIRLVKRYARIHQARFGDRLQVDFQIDPDTLLLRVPPMVLQPLVENAVIHGVGDREEGGRIQISATRWDGKLLLAVADSGPGFAGGGPRPRREGVGLGGTRERLSLLFGGEASFRCLHPLGGGLRAEVVLPEIGTSAPELRTSAELADRGGSS